MVGRTTVSSSGSTGSESFVLIWVHFLNSVGCRFNNQRRGLFLDRVRHQRTPSGRLDHARARRVTRLAPWPFTCRFWLSIHLGPAPLRTPGLAQCAPPAGPLCTLGCPPP